MKFSSPLAVSSVASLAAMAPATTSAWSTGGRGSFFFPQGSLLLNSPAARMLFDEGLGAASPVQRRRRCRDSAPGRSFYRTSPRYEIVDNDELFKLAVDVPGVKMEDVNVSLEDNILTVSGSRESSSETGTFTSRFSQSFSLDPTVDIEKFTASLENGVLIVTAPKDLKRIEDNIRKIPITAVSASTDAPAKVEVGSSETASPDDATAEDQDAKDVAFTEAASTANVDESTKPDAAAELDSDEIVDLDKQADKEPNNEKKSDSDN